jgi:hypothetical protein
MDTLNSNNLNLSQSVVPETTPSVHFFIPQIFTESGKFMLGKFENCKIFNGSGTNNFFKVWCWWCILLDLVDYTWMFNATEHE